MHVIGVDGCREGWLCVEEHENRLLGHIFRSFADLLATLPGASVIAVEIPIGLPEQGRREGDTGNEPVLAL